MSNVNVPRLFKPRRMLGRTGFVASAVGIGDLADRSVPLAECVATVRRAMDYGLNLIDTAPGYEDGYSEEIVGAALRGRRQGLFVIDKVDLLEEPVGPQVDASLARLGMDGVDLFVLHGLSRLDGWNRAIAPGGSMEQLDQCIRAGKARFKGISSHDPETLLAAVKSGLCDVVMFPVGPFVDQRYVNDVLPLARRRQVGTICFKTFGAGKLLGDTSGYNRLLESPARGGDGASGGNAVPRPLLPHLTVSECVHYTLTLDPDVALLGMSSVSELDAAVSAAVAFCSLDSETMAGIRARAAIAVRNKGPCHWDPAGP
jgi:1-deoxyxylulose-5-phosphate synthase